MKFFRKVKLKDRDTSQFQDNVANVLQPLSKLELLDGHLITVTLASGSNKVEHGLGRTPLGWIIVDRSSTATTYRTAWDSTILTLTSSATNTVAIWIF